MRRIPDVSCWYWKLITYLLHSRHLSDLPWQKTLYLTYRTRAIITRSLYITLFYIFHCGLYCKAVSVTDNLCTKQTGYKGARTVNVEVTIIRIESRGQELMDCIFLLLSSTIHSNSKESGKFDLNCHCASHTTVDYLL